MTRDENVRSLAMVLSVLDEAHDTPFDAPRYVNLAAECLDRLDGSVTVVEYGSLQGSPPKATAADLRGLDRILGALFGLRDPGPRLRSIPTQPRNVELQGGERWADDPPMH